MKGWQPPQASQGMGWDHPDTACCTTSYIGTHKLDFGVSQEIQNIFLYNIQYTEIYNRNTQNITEYTEIYRIYNIQKYSICFYY